MAQLETNRGRDAGNLYDLPVDESTDLVTITIGGNNVHFSDILSFCFFSSNCTTQRYAGRSLAQYNREQRDLLSAQLDAVYERIHTQAPNARILVLGYPQVLPASAAEQNCAKLAQRWLPSFGRVAVRRSVGFSQAEQNYLRQAASELNQLIAARVAATGVAEFVPVDSYFAGHEICGRSGEWINALSLRGQFAFRFIGPNDQSFHPNAAGQRFGYAAALNAYLNPPIPQF